MTLKQFDNLISELRDDCTNSEIDIIFYDNLLCGLEQEYDISKEDLGASKIIDNDDVERLIEEAEDGLIADLKDDRRRIRYRVEELNND